MSRAGALAVSVMGLLAILAVGACQSQPQAKHAHGAEYPHADKIDLNLLRLERQVCAQGLSLPAAAAEHGLQVSNGGLVLDIATWRVDADVREALAMPGVELRHVSAKYRRVSAVIEDLGLMHELASIPAVRSISPEYGAVPRGN